MRCPEVHEIVNLIDRTRGTSLLDKIRALLDLTCPDGSFESETAGARNSRLLRLRRMTFGRRMACLATCPACAEVMEFDLDTDDFRYQAQTEPVFVEHDGYELQFRLPTLSDVEAAARAPAPARVLMEACLMSPGPVDLDDPDLQDAVSRGFDRADPLGCITIETACPACTARAMPVLDPAGLLWEEYAASARQIEEDVHILARAYGWAERDIMALPNARRRRYVERIAS